MFASMQVYISMIEAKAYPFVGLQWHPEKNAYEWSRHMDIPHGYLASEVTHQVGGWGGGVARGGGRWGCECSRSVDIPHGYLA